MPVSLSDFDLGAMLRTGLDIRRATHEKATMEEAARAVVRHFHAGCVDPATGARQCALVRFYKTHDYGALEPSLQAFARERLGDTAPWDALKCLVLLASAGDVPEWNARRASRGHQAIPLASAGAVEGAPMIARLLSDVGLDPEQVVRPAPERVGGMAGKTYNVFHVPEAAGSPDIPAQDFVREHGIRSVVGCGGVLLTGDFYALILFARVPVSAEAAARFRNLALDLKLAISPFATVFDPVPTAA